MKILLSFFISILFFCSNCFAASSAIGTVTTTITPAIDVSKSSDLSFGSVSVGATPGTISQDGITTGGVDLVDASNNSAAIFDVSGLGSTSYNFTIPGTVTLTDSGSNEMVANLSFANGSSARSLTEAGVEEVAIYGVLNVGANQAIGNYAGTYNVNVAY